MLEDDFSESIGDVEGTVTEDAFSVFDDNCVGRDSLSLGGESEEVDTSAC